MLTDMLALFLISETGQDPVEECADLEDRFYNNDSFTVRLICPWLNTFYTAIGYW